MGKIMMYPSESRMRKRGLLIRLQWDFRLRNAATFCANEETKLHARYQAAGCI